ncbi:MAG: hypothetical protein AVDCRST_MAG38-1595, partial [uncultured Solirubrobacteraceae bacterium]
ARGHARGLAARRGRRSGFRLPAARADRPLPAGQRLGTAPRRRAQRPLGRRRHRAHARLVRDRRRDHVL